MKLENRLKDYQERIKTCEIYLSEHRKNKKESIQYYDFWIKDWKKRLKKLKVKYRELQKMRTL